jgi:hypothetical protein
MKKQITVLSGLLLFAGVSFGQTMNTSGLELTRAQQKISLSKGATKVVNNTTKAGTVKWQDDFSTPSNWSLGTQGQGSFVIGTWTGNGNQYIGAMASTSAANGYAYFNGVQYLLNATATAQDAWVESGVIDMTGETFARITFEQRYRAFNTDVTTVEVSLDGGTTWAESQEVNADVPTNDPSIQTTEELVFAVNGSATVKLRFRWANSSTSAQYGSGYGWMIDDVKVWTLDDADLVYTYGFFHSEGYQYSQTPTTQVQPITVRAGVKNIGANALTNVKLNLGGDYAGVSSAVTLNTMGVDTLEALFTPNPIIGDYVVTTALTMDQTDDNPANNDFSKDVKFSVSNFTYAVDKGAPYSDFPLYSLAVGGNPVVITGVGTSYDVVASQKVYGLDFMLYKDATDPDVATAIGAEVFAEIYRYNPNATSLQDYWIGPMGESDIFTVESAADINVMKSLAFNTPVQLNAGETYLALIKFAGSEHIEFAAGAGKLKTSQAWMSVQGSQTWGTFDEIPVVRMNFDPAMSVAKNTEAVSGVSIFPNPATEAATIQFNLKEASNVTINVVDVTGKTVQTIVKKAVAGTNNVEVNAETLATGVYTVVINANDSKVTQKLTVK